MYNSIFIGLIMKITRSIQKLYRSSFTHLLISKLDRILRIVYRGSYLNKVNKGSEEIFKKSYIYKGIGMVFKLVDRFLNFIGDLVRKIAVGSEISEGLEFYSKSISTGLRLFYETFILLGILLTLGGLFGLRSLPIYFNVLIILIGIVGIYLNGLEVTAIKESTFVNFFLELFKVDEGGENWW